MGKWWQDRNIYQIYLRSFHDQNNDGVGDLPGVIAKLDYLSRLGIGIIWISPHYDSPMDDNGYDVRDFYRVSSDYGTLADFQALIQAAHAKDIKVVIDLILNHTSDEHDWFQAARDPAHPEHLRYHDYYIWHQPKQNNEGDRVPPTRWIGWFGSPVWDYNEATDEYYLHIFSKKMPDLNWRNPELRTEIKTIINWWIDLGVDGFRVDAANHLEKNWDFPDDFPGYEHFSSLPKHHEYLRELGCEIFVPRDVLTIGESGGATREEALQYAAFSSCEFNMLIQFGHCWADTKGADPRVTGKWSQGPLALNQVKDSFAYWFSVLHGKGWNVIYWHNHDQPRIVSHYGCDSRKYHQLSAKMLAFALYLLPGTAICYQGEEIGMTNVDFRSLEEFRDVEVFTEHANMVARGLSPAQTLAIIKARCRDNARTPMQWSAEQYAGFSTHKPWIGVNGNYRRLNVAAQDIRPDSILSLYRWLLNYRISEPDIRYGTVTFIHPEDNSHFCFLNEGQGSSVLVLCNFRSHGAKVILEGIELDGYSLLKGNRPRARRAPKMKMSLRPYEAIVYRRERRG